MRPLQELWKTFRVGDHLEDHELLAMIRDAEQGLAYLDHRGEEFELARRETVMNLSALKSYREARGIVPRLRNRFLAVLAEGKLVDGRTWPNPDKDPEAKASVFEAFRCSKFSKLGEGGIRLGYPVLIEEILEDDLK